MGRKIRLEREPGWQKRTTWNGAGVGSASYWDKSEPFAMAQTGTLVHRVRYGITFRYPKYGTWGKTGHSAVTYWCNGQTCDPVLLYDVPGGRMVCARCEAAIAAHEARHGVAGPRAADLVGHQVTLGAMVPVKVGVQRPKRS